MKIKISKYHGCGNDFIMVHESWLPEGIDLFDLIVQVCDRRTGIGADGFIIVKEHPLEMVYYNQDGSRAPMCGNGIRCFSRFVQDEGVVKENVFDVHTLAGIKNIEVISSNPWMCRVNMGKPIYGNAMIGVDSPDPVWGYELDVLDEKKKIYSFFMSTVHTVLFDDDPFGDIEEMGKAICMNPLFSEQTNVNFVKVLSPKAIQAATYERGCGLTLACGTGMCASALTAWKAGLTENTVDVAMKKGHLKIEILPDETVLMSGPAKKICKGEFYYDQSA